MSGRFSTEATGSSLPTARSKDCAGSRFRPIDVRRTSNACSSTPKRGRSRLKDIVSSTQPGGLILIDTFAGPGGSGAAGPSNPAYRLRPGELGERFADWEVLEHTCENDREAILVRKRGLRT
jgi:hypothetical protein